MNKAKITLSAIAIISVFGTGLAFKSKNPSKIFYKFGTITVNGVPIRGCLIPVTLTYIPTTTILNTTVIQYVTSPLITNDPSACLTTVWISNVD